VEGLKGIAEIVEYVLYEVVGLIIPGTCFALGVSYAWDPAAAADLLRIASDWPWVSVVSTYVLGLAVQGVSRPVTAVFGGLLKLPWVLIGWGGRLTPQRFRSWVGRGLAAVESFLFHRHSHQYVEGPAEGRVNLNDVAEQRWRQRLGLSDDRRLSASQVRDLSFSAIVSERHRMDRFRATTSLCRGVATAVDVSIAVLLVRIAMGLAPLWSTLGWIIGLIVLFAGLMERAYMYDRLWNYVLQPQFLAVDTRDRDPGDSSADHK
jgi:hypothetical protein